ncbi:hypothetical protein Trco_007417 [Trichoderma cornu-damae]|uniref:C2H2-type domain-containing protein n=1 Tax=Trichoderma cornu-damae TaxID=654480 RepID=A0A9P8QEB3_9HYPO|nr:hypothetical protein Trco_007417 [Trichoderma cornu-damae]
MADGDLKMPPTSEEGDEAERADSPETQTEDLFSQNGDSPPSVSEFKQRQPGLDIVRPWGWSGSSYSDYEYDAYKFYSVVTVHGIRDDYKTAWTEKDGTWWLKNKLFKDLSIREVDYSYDIDEEATIYEPNGIKLHAERLLTTYAKDRAHLEETETDRPIIWVCHDLGGTIAKEIFLGTPHRFRSTEDLEDQLHNLLLLPGPDITYGFSSKVRNLAYHINRINGDFLATKLLDRAAVFNIFVQNRRDSLRQRRADGDESVPKIASKGDVPDPVTPFSRYTHFIGHSFEAAGRFRIDKMNHADLIRGDPDDHWTTAVSNVFNTDGFTINVNYQILQLQAQILSLAPPSRGLDTPFDWLMPIPPALSWIYKQEACIALSKGGKGPRLLHLYANETSLVDIKEISRLFYIGYDSENAVGNPKKTAIYFEFDQWDSRYNDISSMLIYLINTIIWHFWDVFKGNLLLRELNFLSDVRGWSPEDLYHLYETWRFHSRATHQLTFFISGFDQCPQEQRRWFLQRVLEEQSYSEAEYRLVLSSSTRDGLAVENFPNAARINMDDCPAINKLTDKFAEELETGLEDLFEKRPMWRLFQRQLGMLLRGCENSPYLGHIILTWLKNYPRGRPKSAIANKINELSPLTPENIVRVIVSSLIPELRARAENVFNWIKHALEPWSTGSLSEALVVYDFPYQEPCFIDLDAEGVMKEMEEALCGIIIVKNHDVKFSHPSFYLVPEIGVDGSDEERATKVNSTMASICLRYLQLESVQKSITELSSEAFEGEVWKTPLDAVMISNPRAGMAEYAVRFWSHHYKASGNFRPSELVYEMFASKKARGPWEILLWLLSNPFTRPERGYISTLPIFAMLGLEDLVDETIRSEIGQSSFDKDCWFAIMEAARAGHSEVVRKLLQHVSVDEEELQTALYLGAGNGNVGTLGALVKKIPRLETFQWPRLLLHRASAIGLEDLLASMLQSGYDINELSSFSNAPSTTIAVWWNCVSSMEVLLNWRPKADLSIKDESGDTPFSCAVYKGKPRMIEMILQAGENIGDKTRFGQTPVQIAVYNYRHEAANILIEAGADVNGGGKGDVYYLKPPLLLAANLGALECARTLLVHGADPLVSCATGTSLYEAVVNNNVEIAQLLLEQEQKPDLDACPPGEKMLLMRAVDTGNVEIVSTLIKYGIKVDCVDPEGGPLFITPLSLACYQGNLDIVKLLLENNADINYTGGISYSPLFAALYGGSVEVARYLLQDERIDVRWAKEQTGLDALAAASRYPDIVRELLKRGVFIDNHSYWGTILHSAARSLPKTMEVLLENDPKPDLEFICGDATDIESHIGCTPLQISCLYQAAECIKLLLRAGANARFRNKYDKDAVDILLQTNENSENAEKCLRLILSELGENDIYHINKQGQTRLHMIKEKTPVSVVQVLFEAKVPLDTPDKDGYTPLAITIREGNLSVAKYLVKLGANVNAFGPSFGSVIHLAVTKGVVSFVKFLIDSGADCEAVDPKYGASLLYTALGIEGHSELQKMVRYLVDEAKVPINKLGGELGYPIIKAADMTRTNYTTGINMLKFLIRRKAQLNVTDSQGRRAVHLACTSRRDGGIKCLFKAGAEVDIKDKFGRMPIHFAASSPSDNCIKYLLEMNKHTDINAADHDNWTPLLWAARSGDGGTITRLIAENADLWIRGHAYGAGGEWSALKLMNFSDRNTALREELKPKERTRIQYDDEKEEWNDDFHKISVGDRKNGTCKSCLVVSKISLDIIGIQWKCIQCSDDFSLCFKCYSHQSDIHDPEHIFEGIEPLYDRGSIPPSRSSTTSRNHEQEDSHDVGAGNEPNADGIEDEESYASGSRDEEDFDLDNYNLDEDYKIIND